jgi:hypothetical protein
MSLPIPMNLRQAAAAEIENTKTIPLRPCADNVDVDRVDYTRDVRGKSRLHGSTEKVRALPEAEEPNFGSEGT